MRCRRFRCDSPGTPSQVRIESGRWSLENRSNPYVFQQISFLIAVLHRFFNMSNLKYQFYTGFLPFSIRNISFTQVFQRFLFEMSFLHRFFNVFMPKTQFYTGFLTFLISNLTASDPLIALRGAQPYGSGACLRVRCLDDV